MGKHLNFVHNDQIWKDHVRREMQSFNKKWPEKWGYLTHQYRQMNRELDGKSPLPSPEPPVETRNQRDLSPPPEPVPGGPGDSQGRLPPPRSPVPVKLPPLNGACMIAQGDFPKTTARQIGWRMSRAAPGGPGARTLERFPPHARGQMGIFHILNWPHQGV